MGGTPGAPPLGHCPRDVINLKNAPTLGHSQAPPPLGHCPCDVIHIFQVQGWNKIAKGWNKIAEGWNKIAKGWNKIAEGGTKLLKGGTKLLKGGTKLLKGGTKLLKGGTKSLGWATGGGRTTPPTPPGYGPDLDINTVCRITVIRELSSVPKIRYVMCAFGGEAI